MKRISLAVVGLLLVSALFSSPAAARKADAVTVQEARQAATVGADHLGRGSFPGFQGAQVGDFELFRDTAGNPAAYVFRLLKHGESVGYVTVGTNKEDSPLLEASPGTPPQDRLHLAEEAILSKHPGVRLGTPHLIYQGPLTFIAQYELFDGATSLDIENYHLKRGVLISPEEIPPVSVHPSPDKARTAWQRILSGPEQSGDASIMVAGSKQIYVQECLDQDNATMSSSACGPTVAAELVEYFHWQYPDSQGMQYFFYEQDFIDDLYADMGYPVAGASVSAFISGVKKHLAHAPASSGYTISSVSAPNATWSQYRSGIDTYGIVPVRIGSTGFGNAGDGNYSYHWVLGYGYEYDTNLPYYFMNIYNSWDTTCSEAADVIDFERYRTYLSFVFFK